MSHSTSSAPIKGEIVIRVGDREYGFALVGSEDFAFQLSRAVERGHDPAKTLSFLAELGARSYHPDNMTIRGSSHQEWRRLFGDPTQPDEKPGLTLVK